MAREDEDFGAWLIQQKDRDDPIGDLARDALGDALFPFPAGDVETIRRYITRRGSWEARETLEDGVEEWGGTPVRDDDE